MLKLKPILCSLVDVWRGGIGRQSPHSARISPCRFCSPEPCRGFVGAFVPPDGQRFACYFSMRVWRTGWTSASRFRTAVPVNPNNPTVPDLVSPPHPQFTGASGSTAALDLGNGSRIFVDRVVFTQVASFGLNLGGTSISGLGNHARNILVSRCLIDRIEQLPKESPWSAPMVGT
jgi:hypothetical protein